MNKLLMEVISAMIPQKKERIVFRRTFSNDKSYLNREYKKPNKTFEQLISVHGFGGSGSSAVVDYLREFSDCTIVGGVDAYSGALAKELKKVGNMEVDFLRFSGGIFELENLIESKNHIWKNNAIKRLIALTEYMYLNVGGIYNMEYLRLTREFIDELVDFKIKGKAVFDIHCMYWDEYLTKRACKYNLETPFLYDRTEYKIYHLKPMNKKEYRAIAKNYINKFLKTIESETNLVMDAVAADLECNIDKTLEYFDNLKVIKVYRDPRDAYVNAIKCNDNDWVPLGVIDFIKWYRAVTVGSITEEHEKLLTIRFEDMILKYEATAKQINVFVGLNRANQINFNKCLIPEVSRKNIGLYKTYADQDAIAMIEKELSEYCYRE